MKRYFLVLSIIFLFFSTQLFSKEGRILRYPNASKTHIAFTHGGDVFTAPIQGGLARKVTNSDGVEMFPRFSRDGKKLAFSAEYDGNREIYVMPALGGEPERLTYSMDIGELPDRMGPDKIIMQWTKDNSILYRSRQQSWHAWVGQLFLVPESGGFPEMLEVPRSGFASLSPDGTKLAYNRIFREFRTWKRYRGGQADDIWIYDLKSKELKNITNNPAQDIIPMWHGNKIYFLSDRNYVMNLYVHDLNTGNTKQLTNFRKYDVKFPSIGTDYIAFENGGYIYLLDLANDTHKKIDIQIAEDFVTAREKICDASKRIESFEISPDGKLGLFTARGNIFTVPAKNGKTKTLTATSGVHERNAVWSPDGKWIAYISDESGEDEVYVMKPDGSEKTQLTKNSKSYRYELKWSPDSKYLLHSDKTLSLYIIDVENKNVKTIARSKAWEIRDFYWSPDGKYAACTNFCEDFMTYIDVYSVKTGETYTVTDRFFNSHSPEFSEDGKYLFFVSDRTFNPGINKVEWNFYYTSMSKIYGITLEKDTESPFAFEEVNVDVKEDKKKEKKDKKDDEKKEQKNIKIDFENIKSRIFELPVPTGNYGHLVSAGSKLYYNHNSDFYVFDFESKEAKKAGDFRSFEISADKKHIIYKQKKNYFTAKLSDDVKQGEKLDLSGMEFMLNPREEWQQVFDESWRQMKYFFYDPKMHGYDWEEIGKKYREMLPHVTHRTDLTYIIGEMIAELNVGHAYTGGGDMPKVEKVPVGLLGADYEYDENAKMYRITKIYEGRNWEEKTRSPLTEPGINISEGDYILEIDDEKITKEHHPFKALVNKAGKYVTIKVNDKASDKGAEEFDVKTIANEKELRYFNWVEENRRKVEEATDGKVAYVHVPDMMPDHGLNEFVKYFYPQARKEALIIDDRYNGGGNVSPMLIERLRRVLTVAKHARNQDVVMTNPDAVIMGPMVCLINELSASDGDLFPYQFRERGLGKLIGKRTWGGVIGIRGSLPFLDGSYLYKPEFANFGADGTWILEGTGISPDIEVDNHPAEETEGTDRQLNKAIEVILEEMKTSKKPKVPDVPPFPDKNPFDD